MGDDGRGGVRIPAASLHLKGKHHILFLIVLRLRHRRGIGISRPIRMCDGISTAADEKRCTEDSRTSRADLFAGELAPEELDSTAIFHS